MCLVLDAAIKSWRARKKHSRQTHAPVCHNLMSSGCQALISTRQLLRLFNRLTITHGTNPVKNKTNPEAPEWKLRLLEFMLLPC